MTEREFARLTTEVADRAYLTTVGADGYPRTRAMLNLRNPSLYPSLSGLFAAHRDDLLVYFGTNTASHKVGEIAACARGCAYYCHPTRWHGVSLIGDLEVTRDRELRILLWQDAWTAYYPAGVEDPDYSVVVLRPHAVSGWNGREAFRYDLTG